MAQDLPEYTIQEAAARLGIPVQKLRRWDAQGVLVARRTSGGHRRYAREIIDGLTGMSTDAERPPAQASATANPRSGKYEDQLAAARRTLKEKRRIIQLLLESESRYRDLVETSHDLIWTTDAIGRFTYLNNACQDIFGQAPRDLIGRCFFDYEARPSHVSNRRFLSTLRRNGEVKNYLTHLVTRDGSDRWVGINARVSYDDDGRIVGLRGTARNITEQHCAALEIERLATHDPLTGLPNRISLQKVLEAALDDGQKGSVLLLDVDHFKYINDNFGHRTGDQLIVAVGSLLKDLVKEEDAAVYRLGGDEFALHLPRVLRAEAAQMAERALAALRHYKFPVPGRGCLSTLSASIGIVSYPFHGTEVPTLLANVDIAMYQAKDNGRNRLVVHDHDPEHLRGTHRRVHWARELREVLDEDRIVLFSQPVVRLADQKTVHHEVLVRIIDRAGKLILPGQFIEVAESLGMAQEIDMRVVGMVLEAMKRPDMRSRKVRHFVNLSRTSISDPQWVRKFQAMLADAPVDHSQLVFEITETAAMSDVDVTQGFIAQMKQMGCRFALDDFGAGFSSFYFLKRFEVDYLKIDGSFVRDLAGDEANRLFVRALCDVARGLNKQVIAEWVENREVMGILAGMGVQYGQGFLFAHPQPFLPPDEESGEQAARLA
ncbi:MAG TPA: EAL domain-containing protein [Burkholderiales bacterium]|jgi:diguanylate cyclase (GGDEF)-like protein/PAS domain S-box-containing protein/excisionase family DNA binding protein|nr:EAL domain-containing protein [Burkholderiales bacterium]